TQDGRSPAPMGSPHYHEARRRFDMGWGAMSAAGRGPLVRISGRMDCHYYPEVGRAHVLPAIAAIPAGVIFQQDGASVHTAKHVLRFLDDNGIERMAWPAQSPDLFPIENLWQRIKVRVEQREYATTDN
ncbi:MAG: transposase, partial [Porticoccaceae bacterium]|nr:transposase [Porticoccaceae bacterium]